MLIFILTLSVGFNQIKAIEISKELPQPKSRSLVGYLNGNVHRHGHTHGHGHHANHIETNPAVKALEIQDALRENGTVEANGRVCINKVMMTYETQYDEVMTCDHQYSQQCHETYTTVYEPHQEQECDEKFNKICTIEYEDIANNVEVEECKATFITDCNCVDRPTECRTVYDTECSTLQKVHEVEDDITNCTTVYEKKCEPVVLGLKTEEKCDSWPVEKCTLNKQLVKKYTPETKCEKVPREVCAPEGCCIKEGPLNCQNRVKAVVSSKPLELCDLEPIKQCRHVTKLVPQLKPITECTNVPKEICATSKINPKRIARPAIQKWCYTPDSPTTQFTPTPEPKCTTHDDCDDGYVCKEDECIIVSKFLCGENENNWLKVRHVPQSSGGWHPVNDNLMGTAEYGNPNNDDEPWSIKWDLSSFDEFLFASGNMKYWMRASKNDIIGNDGLKLYANEDIKIISSSRSCSPYTAKMYKRKTNDEDPWLSLRDHWDSPNDVMYGENSNIGHNHVRDHNDGMDVYIRKF